MKNKQCLYWKSASGLLWVIPVIYDKIIFCNLNFIYKHVNMNKSKIVLFNLSRSMLFYSEMLHNSL